MPATEPTPADRLRTEEMPWIPTSPGKSFRPLRFDVDGWSELMRLEPGSLVARHRHTGHVHAFNLSGSRRILETGEIVSPRDYVYEAAGLIDAWQAVGDRPCIVHLKILGAVEYLDAKTTSSTPPTPDLSAAPIWSGVNSTTPNRSPRSSGSPAGMKLCCRPSLARR